MIYYLLFLAVGLQLFYLGFFYSRILFIKNNRLEQYDLSTKQLVGVSVIVCAHNELENLKRLIPIILAQEYANFELIIADDRSTDGSFEFFEKSFQSDSRVRIIRMEENTNGVNYKKYALTKAIEFSRFDILLLTDADCLPNSKEWIRLMVSALGKDKKIVLGYSPYEFRKGWLNLLIRYETLHTAIQYFSFALASIPYMGVGRNLLYTKEVFEKNNGFNDHNKIMGGDDDLFISKAANKENVGICIDKKAWVWSLPKENYFAWLRQKRRHLSVGKNYNFKSKVFLGLQLFSHLLYYLGLICLFYVDYKYALAFLMIRGLVFVVIFALIARKLGDTYKWCWLLLPVDVVYIFNYLVIAISLAIYKRIKWN